MFNTEIIAYDEFNQPPETEFDALLDYEEDNELSLLTSKYEVINGRLFDTKGNVAIAKITKPYSLVKLYKKPYLIFNLPKFMISDNNNKIKDIKKSETYKYLWSNGIKYVDFELTELSIDWIKKDLIFHIEQGIHGEVLKTVLDYKWYNSNNFRELELKINEEDETFGIITGYNTKYAIYNINAATNKNVIDDFLNDYTLNKRKLKKHGFRYNHDNIMNKRLIKEHILTWIPMDCDFTIINNGYYEDIVLFDDIKWIC